MNRTDALNAVKKAAQIVLDADPATLDDATSFADDLDADSLDLVELVMSIEDALSIEIGDRDLGDVRTVGDAVELVCSVAQVTA